MHHVRVFGVSVILIFMAMQWYGGPGGERNPVLHLVAAGLVTILWGFPYILVSLFVGFLTKRKER